MDPRRCRTAMHTHIPFAQRAHEISLCVSAAGTRVGTGRSVRAFLLLLMAGTIAELKLALRAQFQHDGWHAVTVWRATSSLHHW
jgi:hypothetical protein